MPGVGSLEATRWIKDGLSPVEILRLLIGGTTNKDLTSAFSIGENTVKNHLRMILEKLHPENRTQAATSSFQLWKPMSVSRIEEAGATRYVYSFLLILTVLQPHVLCFQPRLTHFKMQRRIEETSIESLW